MAWVHLRRKFSRFGSGGYSFNEAGQHTLERPPTPASKALLEADFFDKRSQRVQQSRGIVALNRVTGVRDFDPAAMRQCRG